MRCGPSRTKRRRRLSGKAPSGRSMRPPAGQCGLRPVDEGAGPEIDLAYHYTRASWDKGYATEAAIAVIGHGLGPVSLAAIMAVVVPENVGSWRVMEKAGMRYQGLVDYYGMDGLKKYLAARGWGGPPLVS